MKKTPFVASLAAAALIAFAPARQAAISAEAVAAGAHEVIVDPAGIEAIRAAVARAREWLARRSAAATGAQRPTLDSPPRP